MLPRKTFSSGTSRAMPLTTYTHTPTGGVITPIMVTTTIMTPNQMMS